MGYTKYSIAIEMLLEISRGKVLYIQRDKNMVSDLLNLWIVLRSTRRGRLRIVIRYPILSSFLYVRAV